MRPSGGRINSEQLLRGKAKQVRNAKQLEPVPDLGREVHLPLFPPTVPHTEPIGAATDGATASTWVYVHDGVLHVAEA